jgi:hypothetical protein
MQDCPELIQQYEYKQDEQDEQDEEQQQQQHHLAEEAKRKVPNKRMAKKRQKRRAAGDESVQTGRGEMVFATLEDDRALGRGLAAEVGTEFGFGDQEEERFDAQNGRHSFEALAAELASEFSPESSYADEYECTLSSMQTNFLAANAKEPDALHLHASGNNSAMGGDPMSSKGNEDDKDNADSADAAAVSRRIAQESEKLHRLLQGVSSTQLSGTALAGLLALKRGVAATCDGKTLVQYEAEAEAGISPLTSSSDSDSGD